jgi:hypothetical protein
MRIGPGLIGEKYCNDMDWIKQSVEEVHFMQ